jgi:hypothetical protein
MYSFRPCVFFKFWAKLVRAFVSAAEAAAEPLKSWAQGLVEAPPVVDHW